MAFRADMAAFGPRGWTADRLPDLAGKNFVITGGNSGIGFEAARMLGARGGAVTILCRNPEKAAGAVKALAAAAPEGAFDAAPLDLASLSSIKAAASALSKRLGKIDALVLNAGLMMIPTRTVTADGFETQFGVNHLGHFALAGLLAERVEAAGGRFVSVASIAHKFAFGFRFDDLMFERGYRPARAYAQSKLADLVFALELNRRLEAAGAKARAYACHPGYSATNLQSTGPSRLAAALMRPMNSFIAQSAGKGALPTVLCAAGAEAAPGRYYGPRGLYDMTGPVGEASMTRFARDKDAARRLWEISEALTGVRWAISEGARA